MTCNVNIIGAGLAGSEAALYLAHLGCSVTLFEQRPERTTPVHTGDACAELVCSNSLKSMKPESAAGMLKGELAALGSFLYEAALDNRVSAGGALAVNREDFSESVTRAIESNDRITLVRGEVVSLREDGSVCLAGMSEPVGCDADAVILASGPLTSDALAEWLRGITGEDTLAFYDAAAPIVLADSLDMTKVFRQSRYEEGVGDYLNAPFSKEEYETFAHELVGAERVIMRDFETRDLFQACQPIEEIARKGFDAPRFGPLKPVGLTDPRTGRRPWAALQLRAEDAHGQSFNLVGFQTNLTFPEQKRVFRLIPGLEHAEFVRYGVMHRNTFVDAPHILDTSLRVVSNPLSVPLYMAGQVAGTEGYCEAIRSGLHAAISVFSQPMGKQGVTLPSETAFGALLSYACNPETSDYQPMHVNFGIMTPLERKIRNKGERYAAYAERGNRALGEYRSQLASLGIALRGPIDPSEA